MNQERASSVSDTFLINADAKSSGPGVFYKKGVLRSLAKFTGQPVSEFLF